MGLVISYSGSIKPEMAQPFLDLVRSQCEKRHWPLTAGEHTVAVSSFFGMKKKSVVRPFVRIEIDENCDPFCFIFDANWMIDDFVKTSFADIEIHKDIIEFFDFFTSAGFDFELLDESGYYPDKDSAVLERSRVGFFEMLQEELEKGAIGPIKTTEGRIIDCYYPENE
jgi:hypothetical protein